MANEEKRYFSTKFTVKMFGSRYIPSVCYPIDNHIRATVERLAKEGEAHLYPEKVRFVSGKPIPVKIKESPRASDSNIATKKGGKNRGRDFY